MNARARGDDQDEVIQEGADPSTPFGEPTSQAEAARRAVDAIVEAGLLDKVMAQVDTGELRLTGEGGFLPEMLKRSLEAGLRAELSDHLGYEKGDPAGQGSGNSRNGTTPKRLGTQVGDVDLATPRDRNATFDPKLVGKGQRRLDGLADAIISLYAKGMTVRDIQHHLQSTIGTELSHETISNITEAVAGEVKAWQARPLDPVYPIVYLDALIVKVRDGHTVRNKAAHEDHLHHQQHRVTELPAAEDHQEPWPLPYRRRRGQAVVASDPRHRRPTRPRTSQGSRPTQRPLPQGTTEARRRSPGPGLEPGPGSPLDRLPRPPRHQPLTNTQAHSNNQPTYTEILTTSSLLSL
jgi:hypothetical protein